MTLPRVGNYHAVTPGPAGPAPDTFAPGLAGLRAALLAAGKAPRDGVPREVTRIRGRKVTLICTITDGTADWPPGRDIVPARKKPKQRKKERS